MGGAVPRKDESSPSDRDNMDDGRLPPGEAPHEPMSVSIAREQGGLIKDETDGPDPRTAPQFGEERLGLHGFNQEEERGPQGDGEAVERRQMGSSLSGGDCTAAT
jgi:hypothetical protein